MFKRHPFEIIEDIYTEHYVYLRNFLIGLTKNDEVADEIIQELFSNILQNPQMIQDVSYMKSWLAKGAKNTFLDHYKKKKPQLLHDEDIIESMLIEAQTPEENVIIHQQLESILGSLSTTDKAIILAKEYYGYSYQEISELLHLSIPTLKSKVFRMRKRMIKAR